MCCVISNVLCDMYWVDVKEKTVCLKVGGLKTSGRKAELYARVFVSNEYNVPLL